MKFEDHSLQTLRDLAKSKKGHPGVRGFSTMKKSELAATLKKHFKMKGGALEEKSVSFAQGTGRTKDPFKELQAKLRAKSGAKQPKTGRPKRAEPAPAPKPEPAPEGDIGNLEEFDPIRLKHVTEGGKRIATKNLIDDKLLSHLRRMKELQDPNHPHNVYVRKLKESTKYLKDPEAEGGSVKEQIKSAMKRIGDAIDRIKAHHAKITGGQISEKVKEMANNIDVIGAGVGGDDDIDFDDIKWGKFSDQLKRYNSQNSKNLDLFQFADMILSHPKKFSVTTERRARFYKNVLAKKKC